VGKIDPNLLRRLALIEKNLRNDSISGNSSNSSSNKTKSIPPKEVMVVSVEWIRRVWARNHTKQEKQPVIKQEKQPVNKQEQHQQKQKQKIEAGGMMMAKVILMVGYPGCGKTTFAERLTKYTNAVKLKNKFIHLSQDVLGSRKKVEAGVRNALRAGISVVVDRCNSTRLQRSWFIDVAKEFENCEGIYCVYLNTQIEVACKRCDDRLNEGTHPTLPTKGEGRRVITQMKRDWQNPVGGGGEKGEGLSKVFEIVDNNESQVVATVEELVKFIL